MGNARSGQWYGNRYYYGLHYDLHAKESDTELGTECGKDLLIPMLKAMGPEFVQTDCKGHDGYVSWFSKVPDAAVPPALKKDALQQWRAATRELKLPLHCHYSGIWDKAAGKRHPEWCVVPAKAAAAGAGGQNFSENPDGKMCPRSDYLDKLMIPQMIELIDRYGVDGFWIDGDLWAVEPCYCERCRAAWTRQTGIATPPTETTDPLWPTWWSFTLDSFTEFVTKYCDAVHAHKPGVLVCSNWLQTFCNPGEPTVPTDWISGDNSWAFGMDGSRCEARFLATRGKHWDIMLWSFTKAGPMEDLTSPWYMKPPQMLMQEAAVLLASGGAVQIYETPGLRSGRLVPWRQKRLGEVGRFVKARRALCLDTETIPQIAVLHSEHHLHQTASGKNLMWSIDVEPVRGAVFALLEKHYNVDILDEWALLPKLADYPVVVVPERHKISPQMVDALKRYVETGGKLLVTGAESFATFGGAFLGASVAEEQRDQRYFVSAADGSAPFYSAAWNLLKTGTAEALQPLCETCFTERATPFPAVTVNKVGKGKVAYVPADLFRDIRRNRNPLQREFVGTIIRKLAGRFPIEIDGPACVDVTMRRKGKKTLLHFVNRNTGLPTAPSCPTIDEIPPVGPLTVTMKLAQKPASVTLAFENGKVKWSYAKGTLTATVEAVTIHAALVIA